MLRIENLEVRTGMLQKDLKEMGHGAHCCLILAQEVEQSAHVPRSLLRLPVCLVRGEDLKSVWVVSRAWCVL